MLNKFKYIFLVAALAFNTYASENKVQSKLASGPLLQTIQFTNILANRNSTNTMPTESPVLVSFYTPEKGLCWQQKIDYQDAAFIRAASGLGCSTKINRVEIVPKETRTSSIPAYSPLSIDIDTSKFATQVLIVQDQAPVFYPNTGTIKSPGTVKVKTQSQFH